MIRLSLITLLLVSGFVQAGVYRWVDADGQVHFSDRPQAGAEEVELRDAQTFSAPPAPRSNRADDDTSGSESPFRYESLAITSPSQEEVFWNIEGELTVSMRSQPGLQTGHRIRLFLDGQAMQNLNAGATQARLTGVSRGTHSLRAEIVDRSGTSLAASPTVEFVVQQTSIQNPSNPNRPRPTPRPR